MNSSSFKSVETTLGGFHARSARDCVGRLICENLSYFLCAAEFEGLLERPAPGDWILAADGGLRHLQALALEPTGILGDFDSLGYTPQGPLGRPLSRGEG